MTVVLERLDSPRILAGPRADITAYLALDGDATPDPTGNPVVVVTDEDGSTVVASTAAAIVTGLCALRLTLTAAQTAQVNRLTATWSNVVFGSDPAVTVTSHHEVVGDVLFTLAQARAFDNAALANAATYFDLDIPHARDRAVAFGPWPSGRRNIPLPERVRRGPHPTYDGAVTRIAILTASDKGAAGERDDVSGETLARGCRAAGHTVVVREIVADSRAAIAGILAAWCDAGLADIVLTTGGTGLTARDVTPEATRDIGERDVPGIPLALALAGLPRTPYAALSRGVAVQRGKTLVINLPGSPKAVSEGLEVLLPLFDHIAELLEGPVEHDEQALRDAD